MTPIRPNAFPTQSAPAAASAGADAARQAAQRAFFDAAMGRSAAPAAPPATSAVQTTQAPRPSVFAAGAAAPQHVERRPDPAAEPPTKLLRPGSLLDIRV